MPNYKPRHLPEIGRNLKAMREKLGLTLREVGEMLGVDHKVVVQHEKKGFYEPPWARYAELYRAHPDLRDAHDVTCAIGQVDLLKKSPLYNQLMGLYGRDNWPALQTTRSFRRSKRSARHGTDQARILFACVSDWVL